MNLIIYTGYKNLVKVIPTTFTINNYTIKHLGSVWIAELEL